MSYLPARGDCAKAVQIWAGVLSCVRMAQFNFASWDKPIATPCPQCQFPILTEKVTKRAGLMHKCTKKECGYIDVIDPNWKTGFSG